MTVWPPTVCERCEKRARELVKEKTALARGAVEVTVLCRSHNSGCIAVGDDQGRVVGWWLYTGDVSKPRADTAADARVVH
jgi:hypothetical protein